MTALPKGKILEALGNLNGFLPISPSSKSDAIRKILNMNKNDFQEAVTELINDDLIEVSQSGIRMKVKLPASGRMFRQVRRKSR